jgi:hypothetical protein
LTTKSLDITPQLLSALVVYNATGSSRFFTSMIDTASVYQGKYNYIRNADFNLGVDLWQIGSAGLGFTYTTDSDNVVNGIGSGLIDHTAAGANQKVSATFNIDNKYFGDTLRVSFNYKTLSGYSDGALKLKLINTTPNPDVVIKTIDIPASDTVDEFVAYFDVSNKVSISCTSNVFTTATNHNLLDNDIIRFTSNVGGVYPDTDYYIKLLSATTFSIKSQAEDTDVLQLSDFVAGDNSFYLSNLDSYTFELDFYTNADESNVWNVVVDDVYVGPDYEQIADIDIPKFRRGLLTANTSVKNGSIIFAYTTEDTFDFGQYTQITPNTTFELPTPSSKLRFGILFIAQGSEPVIVHDFGVQLESQTVDMKLMNSPDI